jgi:sucrose-6-phosphate hydrolase SacC (GH32 family)
MTVPREITLRTFPEGIRLVQAPAEPVRGLGEKHQRWAEGPTAEVNQAIAHNPIRSHSFRLTANFDTSRSKEVGLKLFANASSYTLAGFDSGRGELYVDRSHSGRTDFSKDFPVRIAAPLQLSSPKLRLEILADRNSVEVFGDDGHVVLTNLIFPDEDAYGVETVSRGGSSTVELEAWTLRSIWPRNSGN